MKTAKPQQKQPIAKKRRAKTPAKAKKTGGQGKGIAKKARKEPFGRPTIKTDELLHSLCAGIAIGKPTLKVCEELGIGQTTLRNWLADDQNFVRQYARAKDDCADYMAADTQAIAEELPDGSLEPQVFTARQRLRFDARRWYASKLAPKKYGDKIDVDHGVQAGSTLEAALLSQIGTNPASRIKAE